MAVYYGVEYRNMRTAVHGLFIYEDINIACDVDDALSGIDAVDADMEVLQADFMVDEFADLSEINYRDVVWNDELGEYIYEGADPGDTIIVVNTAHDVHDLYGI